MNAFLWGGMLAFFSSFIHPIIKFVFPPSRELDKIVLKYEDYKNMTPFTARTFVFGTKPGILIKK